MSCGKEASLILSFEDMYNVGHFADCRHHKHKNIVSLCRLKQGRICSSRSQQAMRHRPFKSNYMGKDSLRPKKQGKFETSGIHFVGNKVATRSQVYVGQDFTWVHVG